jgi:hypothetical protein
MHSTSRRRWILLACGLGASLVAGKFVFRPPSARQSGPKGKGRDEGNFAAVYGSNELRNVFHLYPTEALDELIAECVRKDPRDFAVFRQLERRISEVTPILGQVRYSLPALAKQKAEMTAQTRRLLADRSSFEGYLELGSHGRYLDALRDHLDIRGPIFTTAPAPPTHSPAGIVDRGAIGLLGEPLAWTDYAPLQGIRNQSLDLVSVYIGFHHAAPESRASFFRSIHSSMSRDGILIVRDHDVTSPELAHLVGLAHDVFNVGTHESFSTNDSERRNFYPLNELIRMLGEEGFVVRGERLRQAGDPTHNTLLAFVKA